LSRRTSTARIDARRPRGVLVARQPLDGHPVRRGVFGVGRPERGDADAPVAERDQVLGRRPGGGAVVDADERRVRPPRAGLDDDGEPPREGGLEQLALVGQGEQDEAVDDGEPDRRGVGAAEPGGHEQHAEPAALEHRGQAAQERDDARVAERVAERLGNTTPTTPARPRRSAAAAGSGPA
jgi:hypothetical protein